MEDGKILDLYFDRDQRALEETQKKYGGYCFTVAHGILGCTEDAEEVVSDTWLRAWDSIPPRRPAFLRRYFYAEPTAAIAGRYGMKDANVLRILSRTRKKLKDYLTKEGYDL